MEEIAYRQSCIRNEQEALDYWYQEVEQKPYLYDQGFPGRGNEKAIVNLKEEINELRALLL